MANDERKDREDRAWEALIVACFLRGRTGPDSYDDPRILSEEDRRVMESMGPDLVDRVAAAVLKGDSSPALDPAAGYAGAGLPGDFLSAPVMTGFGFEIAALHRGDEELTPEAIEEMKRKADELLGGNEGQER
jgi:hypothetical protein